MTVNEDLVEYARTQARASDQKHEQVMRRTMLTKTWIEARRDVKIAKWRSDDHRIFLCFVAFFVCSTIISLAFIIKATIEKEDPAIKLQEMKDDQVRYEQCLDKDWEYNFDYNTCEKP